MSLGIEALNELAVELRTLLDQLGAETGASQGHLRTAWSRCQARLLQYQGQAPDPKKLDPDERAELKQALEEVTRLNAVAASLVSRESDRLSTSLGAVGGRRRQLQGTPSESTLGDRCDMSG